MSNMFKHQGDVSFHAVNSMDAQGEIVKHNGSFVLALGEKTGHRHVITVDKPSDMEIRRLMNNEFLLTLFATATVRHEEHQPIILEVGTYKVGKEREFDHFANVARQVID